MHDHGSGGRRFGKALLVILALVGVPVVASVLALGPGAAPPAVLGVVGALLVSTQVGRARVLPWLPIAVVVDLVGSAYAGSWGWIALLALLGLLSGLGSALGMLAPFAVSGLLASSAAAFGPRDRVLLHLLVFLVGAVWAHLLLGRTALPAVVPRFHVPVPLAVLGGALLAVAAGAAAWGALSVDLASSYYLPMFVFLLAMPAPGVRVSENARRRLVGTALALVLALPLSVIGAPEQLRLVAAVLALAAAVAWVQNLLVSTALSSLAVILLLDPAGAGLDVGETRLLAVSAAAVFVVVAFAIVVAVGRGSGLLPGPAAVEDSDVLPA